MNTEEKVHHGKMTKVERYNWKMQDSPGHLRMVKKGDLQVDHTYQRNANEMKLIAIAKDWSWIACGAIVCSVTQFFCLTPCGCLIGVLQYTHRHTNPEQANEQLPS